jgi:rhodanese-related sulfurtransferase
LPRVAPEGPLPCILKYHMDHEISVPELQEKLKQSASVRGEESFCLLDVREPWEAEVCRLHGALLISMGEIPSRAHQELDPDAHIVVYCHHGVRSLSVALWLREQGFERAQSLSGGIEDWARVVDGSMTRY